MDQLIANHSLYIDTEYEGFINNFCSTTGSNFPQGKLGNYLGSWYEGYLFCLMIGLNTDSRRYEGYKKKYKKMDRWSPQNLKQYKYCIARVMSRLDIINELDIQNREGIKNNFESIEKLMEKVKNICDEFSLGGLDYLMKKYENDRGIFNDPLALKSIFLESVKFSNS